MNKLLLALLVIILMALPIWSAVPAQAEGCVFFTETGGYSVCDDGQASFRTAFETWGLQKIGYPVSRRYERDGFVTQAFQKAIMQWRTDGNYVALVNIFDDLHNDGFDQILLETRQTPKQLPAGWDGEGLSFAQVVAKRQALLNARPALRETYFAASDPLTFYGLPTSEVSDMGNHYAIRLQRAVLQEWKENVPWARIGQVTIANGGDIAKELGGLPTAALAPERGAPAPQPTQAAQPTQVPQPTQIPQPTQAPQPTQVNTDGLIVGGNGFATINAAINAASPGDVILITGGTYAEQVTLDKQLTLQPLSDAPVWIDAQCRRLYGIHITAANATVRGLGVKQSIDSGILVQGLSASNVRLEDNTIQDFDCLDQGPQYRAGIAVWYAGAGQQLINNVIIRRAELAGSLREGKSNCIWFKSSSEFPSGGGHRIAENELRGCFDGIGSELEQDPRGGFDRDTIIEFNDIFLCDDDGIQVEGGTQDVIVRDNYIEGCGTGIAFAPNITGPLYLNRNRIVSGPDDVGVHGQLVCYKVGHPSPGTTFLTENVCQTTGDGIKQTNSGLGRLILRRNTFLVGRYVFEFFEQPTSDTQMDQDCLHTTDPNRFIRWGDARYSSLAAFQSATGQEANGRNCEP